MEKRIELELRGRSPKQITQLYLDNCRSSEIVGLTDEFVNLESLSLINVGLTSLKGFPTLPNLKKLELSRNQISGDLKLLTGSPKLKFLNLGRNKIRDLEALEPVKELQQLTSLDVYKNEVTSIANYRDRLFSLNSSLEYVDGFCRASKKEDSIEEEEYDISDDESLAIAEESESFQDDEEEEEEEDKEYEDDLDDEEEDSLRLEPPHKDSLEAASESDEYEDEESVSDDDSELDAELGEKAEDADGEGDEYEPEVKKRKYEASD